MGQKGTLWFLIVAASWHLWRRDRAFAAGCVWGLLAIKPTLCFLLPIVMLAHRQWRFSSGVIVGTIALGASTGLVVPTWLWSDYWEVVVGSTNYQAHGGYRSGWSVSLWSWLRAAGCSREVTLWLALLVGTVLFAALVRWPGGERQQRLRDPEFLLRALMTTALLSPHFYFYDLVWLLVPIHGLLGTQPRRALAMVALLWLSVLAVQSFDQGPPLLSLLVLSMLAHATRHAANCGTAFAISNRVLITSQ